MDEGLEILTRLWTEDDVTFEGECYQLDCASIAPKPVQNPLPLWVGGSAAKAIERTARWGTGWQAGIDAAPEVGPVVAAIKDKTAEFGRSIDEDHYGAGFGFRFGSLRRFVGEIPGSSHSLRHLRGGFLFRLQSLLQRKVGIRHLGYGCSTRLAHCLVLGILAMKLW